MSSSSQPHDAASSHPGVAAGPASRSAAVSPGNALAQSLRSTSPVYRHAFRGPNHPSRRSRCQDSPYRAASAAAACGVDSLIACCQAASSWSGNPASL